MCSQSEGNGGEDSGSGGEKGSSTVGDQGAFFCTSSDFELDASVGESDVEVIQKLSTESDNTVISFSDCQRAVGVGVMSVDLRGQNKCAIAELDFDVREVL